MHLSLIKAINQYIFKEQTQKVDAELRECLNLQPE